MPEMNINPDNINDQINWEDFFKKHDLVWDRIPRRWYEAPFLGNGNLGSMIYKVGKNAIQWDIGCSRVHDYRANLLDYRLRSPEVLFMGRLPIGKFKLQTVGEIQKGNCRLHLWNAEATGKIITSKGNIKWRTLVHAADPIIYVAFIKSDGELDAKFEFFPDKAESYRLQKIGDLPTDIKENYKANPKPVIRDLGDNIKICEQFLVAGGLTTTGWYKKENDGSRFFITCQHSHPDENATKKAHDALRRVKNLDLDLDLWINSHREWWHKYYPKSFISIPDTEWESFYWIQMYKLASATRANGPLMDNQGPWLQPTLWNACWWNLNVQLSYSPVYTSNRLEFGKSLINHLKINFKNLIKQVEEQYRGDSAGLGRTTGMNLIGKVGKPGGWEFPNKDIGGEVGNLPWICHNLYMHYKYSLDNTMLKDLLYPLLKRAINYYRHFFIEEQNRLHLPPTYSPEYDDKLVKNCNYDLSLLNWGCKTLIKLAKKLEIDEDLIPIWEDILNRMVDYPKNDNGFMIGENKGFNKSHRHWSHLLMIYPLRIVTSENGNGEIIRRSLDRWHSFKDALYGYSYTGAAAISALLEDGNMTLNYLNGLKRFLRPNTMYTELGSPVIETPLHAASVIQDMLLQSWGNTIRIFPAVPEKWGNVIFHKLRAEDAFLVTGQRERGKTKWVMITSLKGGSCKLKTNWAGKIKAILPEGTELEIIQDNFIKICLKKGQDALIYTNQEEFNPKIIPIKAQSGKYNSFGAKTK
jgi:hypothetical protein